MFDLINTGINRARYVRLVAAFRHDNHRDTTTTNSDMTTITLK